MIPNIVKGADMRGLLRYLQGAGRSNEHTDPHIVGGDPYLMAMYGADVLDASDAGDVAAYLDEPRRLFGTEVTTTSWSSDPVTGEKVKEGMRPAHVWHCSLSLSEREGIRGSEEWGTIAQEFMDGMGFTEASGKAPARWVAVHHGQSAAGNDHIHIVASAVREDGTRWDGLFRDWRRAQEVAREIERRYGLEELTSREFGTSEKGVSHAERSASERAGLSSPASRILSDRIRAAAVSSKSEAEWIRRTRGDGIVLKPYFAKGTTDVVTGYRAALKPERYNDSLVFFGGKRLGQDLSLPRLRECWSSPSIEDADAAAAEWQAAFRGQKPAEVGGREKLAISDRAPAAAARSFAEFNDRLAAIAFSDRDGFSAAARDVAGALAAWAKYDPAQRTELAGAARTIARSAQTHRRAVPPGRRQAASVMGTALLFEQARHEGRGQIPAAIFMQQILRTAEAIRDFHRTRGNAREAALVQSRAIEQLQKVPLLGYQESSVQGRNPGSVGPVRDPRRAATVPGPLTSETRSATAGSPLPRQLDPRQRSNHDHGR